jgi:acyl-CoA hydrolase
MSYGEPEPDDLKIGQHIAALVEDGSTLQAGIGCIPDAVLRCLKNHRRLGLHTEMYSDGALALLEAGAIDNSEKKVHRGKSVSSFLMGSKRLYDFVHENPSTWLLPADYVNMPINIARNPKVVAINSAVQIDLTGQVCADSVGERIISGVGGQMDFLRGAALSEGGKPILAFRSRKTSRSGKSQSKIVPILDPGAGVVTTRAHVHYVATEHGIVNLFGKTLSERARSLISIAHPADREALEKAWVERIRRNRRA